MAARRATTAAPQRPRARVDVRVLSTVGFPPTGKRPRTHSRTTCPLTAGGRRLRARPDDAHQDHRLVGKLATTVWRDQVVLHYEIPKWDGDLGRSQPRTWPLDEDAARRKVALLTECLPEPSRARVVGRRDVPGAPAVARGRVPLEVRRGLRRAEGEARPCRLPRVTRTPAAAAPCACDPVGLVHEVPTVPVHNCLVMDESRGGLDSPSVTGSRPVSRLRAMTNRRFAEQDMAYSNRDRGLPGLLVDVPRLRTRPRSQVGRGLGGSRDGQSSRSGPDGGTSAGCSPRPAPLGRW